MDWWHCYNSPLLCRWLLQRPFCWHSLLVQICQRDIDMMYNTIDKDGSVLTLPLFTNINVHTQRYMFSHPNGLVLATHFAQIALLPRRLHLLTCAPRVWYSTTLPLQGTHSENTPSSHPLPTFSLSRPLLMSFSIVVSPCRALLSVIHKTGQCVLLIQAACKGVRSPPVQTRDIGCSSVCY